MKNRLSNHKKVIRFPSSDIQPEDGILWRFFDYLEGVRNVIDGWLTEEARDVFEALLKQNSKIELPIHWGGMKVLQGEGKEEAIWEWRFKAERRQQRVLGVFGDVRKQAVFLIGCSHKDDIYTPPDCVKTAVRRAKEVREKKANLNERKIKSDI